MMVFVIPTWIVRVSGESGIEHEEFRVPETNLDQFLHVLTFNKREFTVRLERGPVQEATP